MWVSFSRALQNVLSIVTQAGGQADNIGRLTIFITDMGGYLGNLQALGRAYRELMGRHYPAMALVEVSRLVHPRAMVEIEGLAVVA